MKHLPMLVWVDHYQSKQDVQIKNTGTDNRCPYPCECVIRLKEAELVAGFFGHQGWAPEG
jgi:hypothetical protein